MQTEAFRFGNKIVDEWEGRVNAWPLDEGLIDYVDQGYGTASDSNPLYAANVIANKTLTVGGRKIDASAITKELLRSLQEAERIEANVATGYHAIEFLLVGTGPQRHRARRRHAARDRLRPEALHRRQLRPAYRVPSRRHGSARRGSRGNGRQLEAGRRGA